MLTNLPPLGRFFYLHLHQTPGDFDRPGIQFLDLDPQNVAFVVIPEEILCDNCTDIEFRGYQIFPDAGKRLGSPFNPNGDFKVSFPCFHY